jgi:predicted alpha/beta hydrolase
VPLSDEEARLLHQLEQSLAAEDPDFASTLRGSKFLAHNRRIAVLAVLGFLAGIALLFSGAVSAMTWLGALGFVVMLGAAYVFVTAWRRGIGPDEEGEGSSQKPSGSFVDRLEERWQRRQDGGEI